MTSLPGRKYNLVTNGGILHHRSEVCIVITRQLQAAEGLSKLSTMNDKSSFISVSDDLAAYVIL
jgi:hypothetical protein